MGLLFCCYRAVCEKQPGLVGLLLVLANGGTSPRYLYLDELAPGLAIKKDLGSLA